MWPICPLQPIVNFPVEARLILDAPPPFLSASGAAPWRSTTRSPRCTRKLTNALYCTWFTVFLFSLLLQENSTFLLNRKLRRGDKFTDVQFLRSPIFKQKPGRRSVQNSRNSRSVHQPFEKYNESFVGCRWKLLPDFEVIFNLVFFLVLLSVRFLCDKEQLW